MVVNRDSKTGLNYLSIKGNEAQGVSVIITSDKDIETLNKLADEFQKYPVSSQRSTAGLYALLEISGNLKCEKDGFTFLTPNGIMILSILVDTFISKISFPMQPGPEIGSISDA